MKLKQITTYIMITTFILGGFSHIPHAQAEVVRDIIFPVLGGGSYTNDFNDPRSGGRTHGATDIMAAKMQRVVAVADGVITFLPTIEPSWGWSISMMDKDGYEYNYLHLNNDTPGTDDGNGGYNNAYTPGLREGSVVIAGQELGFLGDSGNAEETPPHIHFEIIDPNGDRVNPYFSLKEARVLSAPIENPNKSKVTSSPRSPEPKKVIPQDQKSTTQITFDKLFPYEQFEGGATIASGNLDKDLELEFVTGTAFGGGGRTIIKTYDPDGTKLSEFFAYGDVFRGGGDVTTADVDGDGVEEIITTAGPGGGPHVKIFKTNGTLVSEFMAYDAGFHGGVYISAADIDGDGNVEIVTAPAATGGPHVKVFNKDGVLKNEFMAYSGGFFGGVDVAAFSPIGNVKGGIVTVPGATGGPHVKVYSANALLVSEFFGFDGSFTNGLRVDAGNLISDNGAMEVVLMPARNSASTLRVYKTDGQLLKDLSVGFSTSVIGGFDLAIIDRDVLAVTSGGRKTEVVKAKGL